MISIFYDLETTDLERVGQILNFAFIAVDDDFVPIESISANVKISRLQLPRVGAILTNRTNVIEHQKVATLTEHEAVLKINEFLNRTITRAGGSSIAMVGYNSASFDLDFLRTVFIRNGINPYNGRVQHKDLLLVSRYLMAFNDSFREKLFTNAGDDKVRLKLEGLCKLFGLLEGAQDHESLSDVLLTIELAKVYKNIFQVDVRQFEPYQVKELHNKTESELNILAEPLSSNFKPDKRCRTYPATLLDVNERYALWIDLAKYSTIKKKSLDPKGAIKWKKFVEHIVIKHDEPSEEDFTSAMSEALEELKGINLGNYFTETTCDIEQFIYRIRPNEIDLLRNAMNAGSSTPSFTTDMNQLLKRFWLENYAQEPTAEFNTALERYAVYRYGGKLQLTNSSEDGAKIHATLPMLFGEIEKAATTATTDEDKALINSLRQHYLESDIYRVAGTTLLKADTQNT